MPTKKAPHREDNALIVGGAQLGNLSAGLPGTRRNAQLALDRLARNHPDIRAEAERLAGDQPGDVEVLDATLRFMWLHEVLEALDLLEKIKDEEKIGEQGT